MARSNRVSTCPAVSNAYPPHGGLCFDCGDCPAIAPSFTDGVGFLWRALESFAKSTWSLPTFPVHPQGAPVAIRSGPEFMARGRIMPDNASMIDNSCRAGSHEQESYLSFRFSSVPYRRVCGAAKPPSGYAVRADSRKSARMPLSAINARGPVARFLAPNAVGLVIGAGWRFQAVRVVRGVPSLVSTLLVLA